MDGRRITWTQTAVNQRDFIFRYWNEMNKSKNYYRKLNRLFKGSLKLLKEFPELGKLTNEKNLRLLIVLHIISFLELRSTRFLLWGSGIVGEIPGSAQLF